MRTMLTVVVVLLIASVILAVLATNHRRTVANALVLQVVPVSLLQDSPAAQAQPESVQSQGGGAVSMAYATDCAFSCTPPDACYRLIFNCACSWDDYDDICNHALDPCFYWVHCTLIPACYPTQGTYNKWRVDPNQNPTGCNPKEFCGLITDFCCCFTPSEVQTLKANCKLVVSICNCQETCLDCEENCNN